MNEEILCVVETASGMGYLEKMLYFTSERLIVAKIESKGARFDPVGLFDLFSLFKRGKKIGRLSKLSPEAILSTDKGNFAIPYVEISKVELFKKMKGKKIRITTATGENEFWLGKPKESEKYADILRPVLTDKLSIEELTGDVGVAEAGEGNISPKSRLTTTILCALPIWVMIHGLHRFYLGKIGTGVLMLVTFGGFYIWTVIDFTHAVTGRMKDKQGKIVMRW